MASNINYASIDEFYPIAGKDNDSQGFRDNFGYIKQSLQDAKTEIEDLQNNTAKTNENNSFNFLTVSEVQFKNWGETLHSGSTIDTDTIVNYSNGSIQTFKINGDISLILEGFPQSGIVGKLRIQLTNNNNNNTITPHTVTFELQGGNFKKNSLFNGYSGTLAQLSSNNTVNPVTITSETNPVIFDFWSYDGGLTVFMDYVGTFT